LLHGSERSDINPKATFVVKELEDVTVPVQRLKMSASHACGAMYNWEHSNEPCFLLEGDQLTRATVRARVAAVAAGLRSLVPVGTCVAFAGMHLPSVHRPHQSLL
jgi:hypothetical protein